MLISVNFTEPRPGLPNGAQFCVELYNLTPQQIQQMALDFVNQIHKADKEAGLIEKPVYNIYFDSYGDRKIECIRIIRAYFNFSLIDAKLATECNMNKVMVEVNDESVAQHFVDDISRVGGSAHFKKKS